MSECGQLYLVPTPIGNLEDMTYRAVRVLSEVDIVAAEDTRHTGTLLAHFQIAAKLVSYHEHNKEDVGPRLIQQIQGGMSVACVSDAGMPAISDPGADLVQLAWAAGIPVVALPGPNAALTALIASGMDTTLFTFVGFLPKRKANRVEKLAQVANYEGSLLFYEAPHRIREVLPDMLAVLGNRPVCVGRELTKKFETYTKTTLADWLVNPDLVLQKGEFVLVVGGVDTCLTPSTEEPSETEADPVMLVQELVQGGMPKKEAIREIAKRTGLARRVIYNAVEASTAEEE